MNKIAFRQAMNLLSRFLQEYDIDPYDPRFDEFERDLLRTAQDDATFYGRKYESRLPRGEVGVPEGKIGKSNRKATGV